MYEGHFTASGMCLSEIRLLLGLADPTHRKPRGSAKLKLGMCILGQLCVVTYIGFMLPGLIMSVFLVHILCWS